MVTVLSEYEQAMQAYLAKWHQLIDARADKAQFESLRPTALGWKVADRDEYDRRLAELHESASRIIETWMNGRWIAKVVLRDTVLPGGVTIIKIMQRRPDSTDAVGLDHADFYGSEMTSVEQTLTAEPDLKWSRESNDIIEGYDWLSIWFDGTEAKLKHDTVLGIVAAELQQINEQLLR
jgi:hypothetical protein